MDTNDLSADILQQQSFDNFLAQALQRLYDFDIVDSPELKHMQPAERRGPGDG